jgi:type IV pilus assembly protein PilN
MLVEINFIEKKKKPSYLGIGFVILLVLFILLLVYLLIYGQSLQEQEAKLQENVAFATKLQAMKMKANKQNPKIESFHQYETAVKWAQNQSIETTKLLKEVTKKLPERGYLLQFSLTDDQKVDMIVQFDTKSEIAYYLKRLNDISWIKKATLKSFGVPLQTNDTTNYTNNNTTNNPTIDPTTLPRYQAEYILQLKTSKLKNDTEKDE